MVDFELFRLALEAALGIRPAWHNGTMETFGPGGSVISAMLAIACGLARHVLCFRTLWEATHSELMKQGEITPSMGRMSGWQMPFGATSAAHTLAMNAQRHFDRHHLGGHHVLDRGVHDRHPSQSIGKLARVSYRSPERSTGG